MQPLEEDEYFFDVLWLNPYAVIPNGEYPGVVLLLGCHVNSRWLLIAVLNRICDQVLKHNHKLHFVCPNMR